MGGRRGRARLAGRVGQVGRAGLGGARRGGMAASSPMPQTAARWSGSKGHRRPRSFGKVLREKVASHWVALADAHAVLATSYYLIHTGYAPPLAQTPQRAPRPTRLPLQPSELCWRVPTDGKHAGPAPPLTPTPQRAPRPTGWPTQTLKLWWRGTY